MIRNVKLITPALSLMRIQHFTWKLKLLSSPPPEDVPQDRNRISSSQLQREEDTKFFTKELSDRGRGSGFKLKGGKFGSDIRKYLPFGGEALAKDVQRWCWRPIPEVFKGKLEQPGPVKVSLFIARIGNCTTFNVPSNPSHSVIILFVFPQTYLSAADLNSPYWLVPGLDGNVNES